MTASKIIDKAILLLGYDTLKNTGSISGFEHAALTALNIVYADIFYLYNFNRGAAKCQVLLLYTTYN